jgi:hypothetical protein
MTTHLQKIVGIAALGHAVALMLGLVLSFTLMFPLLDASPDRPLKFLAGNQGLVTLWHLLDWGTAITLMTMLLALYPWLKAGSPALTLTATACGLVWAGLMVGTGDLMLHNFGVSPILFAADQLRPRHGPRWRAACGCCSSAWRLCEREGSPGEPASWACVSASRESSR